VTVTLEEPVVLGVVGVVAALVLVWLIVLTVRQRRLSAYFRALARSRGKPSVEQTVIELAQAAEELDVRTRELVARLARVEDVSSRAVTGLGLVRYNPFPDTGGNFSWSVALVDEKGDGVIITSLNSRKESRFYLKELSGFRCPLPLSDEEEEALRIAMKKTR